MIRGLLLLSSLVGLGCGYNLLMYHNLLDTLKENAVIEKAVMARPSIDANATLVDMEFSLQSIQELDETTGVMTTSGWVDLSWNNPFLTWDPEEFEGIKEIRLQPKQVWVPDIFVFNDASGQYNARVQANNVPVIIDSFGNHFWYTPVTIRSLCDITEMNATMRNCSIVFGSWTHSAMEVDVVPTRPSADLSKFNGNTLWELMKVPAERHSRVYECCPEPYIDVTYTIQLAKRRTGDADNVDSHETDDDEEEYNFTNFEDEDD